MIVLLDTSHDLDTCAEELGCEVEQLLTPLTRFRLQRPGSRFAIDNGAFAGFDASSFVTLLEREEERRENCIFVAVPDVVGSARRTLEVFENWKERLAGWWPLALVAQDGQEHLPIPWGDIDAVFIGGSTEWKLSAHAAQIVRAATALGKWVHAGRVNTPARFEYFEKLGADSIDGTGLSRYSWMRERIYSRHQKPSLFDECLCDVLHTSLGCPAHGTLNDLSQSTARNGEGLGDIHVYQYG
jgi:hypothetical protein